MAHSNRRENTRPATPAQETRALVREKTLLGVYPGALEVRQLLNGLQPIGFDLRKLSIVFLGIGRPAGVVPFGRDGRDGHDGTDPFTELRERLRLHGTTFVASAGRIWVAGPLAGIVSPIAGITGAPRGSRSVVRAVDEALSRWGVRLEELSALNASMASGRGLVLLHVTAGEVPSTLFAMKRSPAEYVTLIGHDHEHGSFGPWRARSERFSRLH